MANQIYTESAFALLFKVIQIVLMQKLVLRGGGFGVRGFLCPGAACEECQGLSTFN